MTSILEVLLRAEAARTAAGEAQLKELKRISRGIDAIAKMQLAQHASTFWRDLMETTPLIADLVKCSLNFRSAADAHCLVVLVELLGSSARELSSKLYENLKTDERADFIKWILVRYGKIDTRTDGELASYMATLESAKCLPKLGEIFVGKNKYNINDLSSIGYKDMRFATSSPWILTNDFYLRQYYHEMVHPRRGDVIIDAGAYHGDSAILFAHDTGYECEIHSFEISAMNIEVFKKNIELNPKTTGIIHVEQRALSSASGRVMYFDESVSDTSMFSVRSENGSCSDLSRIETVSLDDYVQERGLNTVDFIKMDIEGGERDALLGAQRTLSTLKPRLAIAIYHRFDDLFVLPELILRANPNYRFGFKWTNRKATNEVVLFAIDTSSPGGCKIPSWQPGD